MHCSLFRSINTRVLASAAAMFFCTAFAACSKDTIVTPVVRPLTGNWGSPNHTYASLALSEANGVVYGHGWLDQGVPVGVEGFLIGSHLTLKLRRVESPRATLTYQLLADI